MLTLHPPRSGGLLATGEATHTVRQATVTLAHVGQAALLREALPLALQAVLDGVAARAEAAEAGTHRRGAAADPGGRLWLLRHLPCRLRLSAGADLHQTVRALERALQQAWAEASRDVRHDGGEMPWLVLDDPTEALLGAWADALAGRRDRAWAWARLGLWPGDLSASSANTLPKLLQALDRHPLLEAAGPDPSPAQRRRALLAHWLQQGLLPRALALLAPQQALQLAQGLPGQAALAAAMAELQGSEADAASPSPTASSEGAPSPATWAAVWPSGPEAAACRAALALAPLPAHARSSAALWLAWLAQLHADPGALVGPSRPRVQAGLQALAQAALAPRTTECQRAPRETAAPSPEPVAAQRWPTRHAGLLHLLPLLPEALPAHNEGWSRARLLRLAVHGLQVPLADPVLAPWLGALAPAHWADAPPSDADGSVAALQADLAALRQAVCTRLQRHLAPERRADIDTDPWPWLLQRPATLLAAPGRWEVLFDEADTRLRLCGLDRDPGFLPWLGLSVVLRYE